MYVDPAGSFTSTAPTGSATLGACPVPQQLLTESPALHVGDNGAFVGYAIKGQQGQFANWHVVGGNAPSANSQIACNEIPLSFTAKPVLAETLSSFLSRNSNGVFSPAHTLSLTIMVTDEDIDCTFNTNGATTTTLRAGTKHSISWGNSQNYTLQQAFFNNFAFTSLAEVTVSWEQAII
jgi:hypothetical protein